MGNASIARTAGSRHSAARPKLSISTSVLAWTLALAAVALLAQALAYLFWYGHLVLVNLVLVSQIVCALVGALIASHHPRNAVAWLLISFALATGITVLPFEYGYSVATSHSSLPYASLALWFSNWAQLLPFGLAFAMIALRFPDGRVPHRWRFVDWLAVAGTAGFVVAIALTPGPILKTGGMEIDNPFGLSSVRGPVAVMFSAGLGLIGAAVVCAVASLLARYRRADHEQRLQLKWIVLASGIAMAALVFAAVAEIAFHASLNATLTPFAVTLNLVPLTIGVAILRHRLFDIDLIISRTLVYAMLTAILGGVYVGGIELIQRLFIFYTGEKSDSAIVVTAFVVAGAFTPVQKWSEKVVERRLGGRDPADRLDVFTASVEGVVRVIDPHRVARRLVEESVGVFEAVGGALYLDSYGQAQPFHAHGSLDGQCAVEVAVRHAERSLGRLMLGHRRGGATYSARDRKALQRSADAVGQALGVGAELGLVSMKTEAETRFTRQSS